MPAIGIKAGQRSFAGVKKGHRPPAPKRSYSAPYHGPISDVRMHSPHRARGATGYTRPVARKAHESIRNLYGVKPKSVVRKEAQAERAFRQRLKANRLRSSDLPRLRALRREAINHYYRYELFSRIPIGSGDLQQYGESLVPRIAAPYMAPQAKPRRNPDLYKYTPDADLRRILRKYSV